VIAPPVRLTQLAQRAGCAAKQPPGYLLPLLGTLPAITDRSVLIGSSTADDAAVYKLDDERALVLTTDFFTPIVDDPYAFGQIACANALSDVYAMGGRPLTGLNLVGFPDHLLPTSVLGDILRGGADKAREAGIDLVGGHTIKSDEPIYGLAVTGMVHPARVVSNAGARAGDRLVLSKPLGLGIITTAAKQDRDQAGAIGEAIAVMSRLNDTACAAMLEVGVPAATDVTGFGLCGHLRNLLAASGVRAQLWLDRVPVLPAARRYAEAGIVPGGTRANWRFLGEWVDWGGIGETDQLLLSDAQTSGGLLMAVPAERAGVLVEALRARGTLAAAIIGVIEAAAPDSSGKMKVLRTQGETIP
jgi:selenide,water dikinase